MLAIAPGGSEGARPTAPARSGERGGTQQSWRVSEYLRWLFLPQSVLEQRGRSQVVTFPDWNPVLLVSDHETIRKIHKTTSKVFLGGAGNEFLGPVP